MHVSDAKHTIVIKTNSNAKEIKLTEIPIMDRYSIGSTIVKTKIDDVYEMVKLTKEETEKEPFNADKKKDKNQVEKDVKQKKEVSLKEIDDKFMTIDDFLDNFD